MAKLKGQRQALSSCQMHKWLSSFKDLAYRTELIELPQSWIKFLTADGVYVSEGSKAEGMDTVLAKIDEAIHRLGGAVSPKLNWSCPKDAVWVATGHTHRCTNADEVVLLLQASDRVSHDICNSLTELKEGETELLPLVIALRKWHKLSPDREFRCFVRHDQLAGVSQRKLAQHFAALVEQKDKYLNVLTDFFEEHLQSKFPAEDYTFDVYITSAGKVKLIDFNPVFGTTSPLLFSWEDLYYNNTSSGSSRDGIDCKREAASEEAQQIATASAEESTAEDMDSKPAGEQRTANDCILSSMRMIQSVEFRVLTEENKVQHTMPTYGVPYDLVDNSEGSAYSDLIEKFRERQMSEQ